MEKNLKELLLKDLCARIRCRVKVILPEIRKDIATLVGISDTCYIVAYDNSIINCPFEIEIKPYLRPMSSMTEIEYMELKAAYDNGSNGLFDEYSHIDWLNSHHFDYRNLVEKKLALEAPKGMYNIKDK